MLGLIKSMEHTIQECIVRTNKQCHDFSRKKVGCIGLMTFLFLLVIGEGYAESWFMFYRDIHNSGYLETEMIPPLKMLWKTPIPDPYHPVVSNGTVFIGTHSHGIYALDMESGQIKWNFGIHDPNISRYSPLKTAPAVDGNMLFIHSWDNRVWALDADTGELIWKYESPYPITRDAYPGHYPHSSPTVFQGILYVGLPDRLVHAIDIETGQDVWTFNTSKLIQCTPSIWNGSLLVGTGHSGSGGTNYFYSLDLQTGDLNWQKSVNGGIRSSAVRGDQVYLSAANNFYSLDCTTGMEIWTYTLPASNWVTSFPVLSESAVLFSTNQDDWQHAWGPLYALDIDTGDLLWENSRDYFEHSAASITGDIVWIGEWPCPIDRSARLYALNVTNGEHLWFYEFDGLPYVHSAPCFSGGSMFVGAGSYVYAFVSWTIPEVLEIGPITFNEDEQSDMLDLNEYVEDQNTPDSDIEWSISGNTHISFHVDNETSAAYFYAEKDWYGRETITLTAQDPENQTGSQLVEIIVLPINDPPKLLQVPSQIGQEDQPWDLDIMEYIIDIDTPINQMILSTNSSQIKVFSTRLHFDYTDEVALHSVEIIVSDGQYENRQVISIQVIPVNDPPTLQDIPDLTFNEDEYGIIILKDFVLDPDNELNQLRWTVTGQESLQVSIILQEATILPPENWYGNEILEFTVEDPEGLRDSDNVTVRVEPINDPPSISLTRINVTEDIVFVFDTSDWIEDIDDNVSDILVFADSGYIDVQDQILTLYYPDEITEENVRLVLSDGNANSTSILNVNISPNNDPPKIDEIPIVKLPQGGMAVVDLNTFCSDPDNSIEELIWTASPQDPTQLQAKLNESTNQLTLILNPETLGSEEVLLTLRDPDGIEDHRVLKVEVVESTILFTILLVLGKSSSFLFSDYEPPLQFR